MNTDKPKQRIAAKAVIEADGCIIALHPSAIDLNRKWHIPGGIRDDIAEPLTMTAVREVLEETGIDLTNLKGRVFKIGEWPAVDQGENVKILAVFFHFVLPTKPSITLSHEHDDMVWLNKLNYHQYDTNPEVGQIIEELL